MATASFSITPECSICCETFKTPKILQCGHTYCLDCIDRYIGDKTDTFLCPICGQNITIPEGGPKMFITNFILQTTTQGAKVSTTQPPASDIADTPTSHTTQPPASNIADTPTSHTTIVSAQSVSPVNHDCPYHKRPVDYYCISCHSLICPKCFVKDHQGHEYLDVECETSKERAKELVSTSEKFIRNKIKELEETHTKFVEASQKLLSYTEDACRRISQQTEKIIEDIKTSSQTAMLDIRTKFEESECILTGARDNIMEQMKNVKLDLETNLPSLSEDSCVQILASVPKIKELEKLCESMKDNSPVLYEYMDWEERDFSLDIDMLGSVVKKSYYIDKQNCFRLRFKFDKDKIVNRQKCKDKFNINGTEIEFCCSVWISNWFLTISNELLNVDNPGQNNSIIIDGQLSLLNIDDDSQTLTTPLSNQKLTTRGSNWTWENVVSWFELRNGNFLSNNQFTVQLDITQIKEI